MNFGLPVVVSSTCGCAYDLVKDPGNGAIFATGDIDQLSRCINRFLSLDDKERSEVRALNDSLLTVYNYNTIIKELESIAV